MLTIQWVTGVLSHIHTDEYDKKIHSYAIHIRFRVPQSHIQFYANSHCLKRKHAYTFTCTEILQSIRISQTLTTRKTHSLTTHFHTSPYSNVLPHKQDKKETHHIVTTQKHANVSVHAHHPYIQWVQWNITWKMLAHNEAAQAGSHIHLHREIHIYTHSHIHYKTSLSIHTLKYAHKVTHIQRHTLKHTEWHIHPHNVVTFTQLHDHAHIHSHRGCHSDIHLHMPINIEKISIMLVRTLTQKHAHIHYETYALKHTYVNFQMPS